MARATYEDVDASPVKRFFVEMLTRDILVEDAILDLLDNCLDGVLRSKVTPSNPEKPYDGFWAEITVTEDAFEIVDNCGGIPWSEHARAFRLGRPKPTSAEPEDSLSVGVYGIGMKRAIFKMGTEARVWTQNGGDNYVVPITAAWMHSEESWTLPVQAERERMPHDGTRISITQLHGSIRDRFGSETFQDDLLDKIANHYAVIIHKGFVVRVNKIVAESQPIELRFAQDESKEQDVRPYVFKAKYDDVDVFLAVGLREPIPAVENMLDEQETVRYSADYAGWTVICNDRVILYCDRTELTGWGTAGIPRYHNQFIAISGVVEFTGDPSKLPTVTTKRGLEFSSPLYQQTLNRMREGLALFIDFTNKWKAREEEAKNLVSPVPAVPYSQLKGRANKELTFRKTKTGLPGEQYRPTLPLPPDNAKDVRISYWRDRTVLSELAEQLLEDYEETRAMEIPRKVGEASFDYAYSRFVKKK